MSELPDFTTAPAWIGDNGVFNAGADAAAIAAHAPYVLEGCEWTPLRTADEWARHIDRDKLAEMLKPYFNGGDVAYGEHVECADAVLDALPELMGGDER